MKIQVTMEDIIKGAAGDPCNCPVARAVARQTEFAEVKVFDDDDNPDRIAITLTSGNGETKSVIAPTSVDRFVTMFDSGDEVSPFEFELEV